MKLRELLKRMNGHEKPRPNDRVEVERRLHEVERKITKAHEMTKRSGG